MFNYAGTCAYSHDVRFKDAYEKSSKFGKLGYEEKLEGFLRRLHNEMQNKIRKHNERLELTQGPKRPLVNACLKYCRLNANSGW
jgi:hypothetical protein